MYKDKLLFLCDIDRIDSDSSNILDDSTSLFHINRLLPYLHNKNGIEYTPALSDKYSIPFIFKKLQ